MGLGGNIGPTNGALGRAEVLLPKPKLRITIVAGSRRVQSISVQFEVLPQAEMRALADPGVSGSGVDTKAWHPIIWYEQAMANYSRPGLCVVTRRGLGAGNSPLPERR